MFSLIKLATATGLLVLASTGANAVDQPQVAQATQEVHLRNIRQLTFEGENAEAYFSFDGTKLIFTGSSLYTTGEVFIADADGSISSPSVTRR